MTQQRSYFKQVGDFNEKFGLPVASLAAAPTPLAPDVLLYRLQFMLEELAEYAESQGVAKLAAELRLLHGSLQWLVGAEVAPITGLADGADALADLAYVVLGTAHLHRFPFDDVWDEVQRANMQKERATGADDARSKRRHALDVIKPPGWRAPNHWPALYARAQEALVTTVDNDPNTV